MNCIDILHAQISLSSVKLDDDDTKDHKIISNTIYGKKWYIIMYNIVMARNDDDSNK